jgi:hypothetical protein
MQVVRNSGSLGPGLAFLNQPTSVPARRAGAADLSESRDERTFPGLAVNLFDNNLDGEYNAKDAIPRHLAANEDAVGAVSGEKQRAIARYGSAGTNARVHLSLSA